MLCLQVCSDRPPNISPSSHALQQSKFDLGEVEVKPVSQPFSILNVPLRFITTIRPKPQKVLRAVAHSTGLVFVESSPPPPSPLESTSQASQTWTACKRPHRGDQLHIFRFLSIPRQLHTTRQAVDAGDKVDHVVPCLMSPNKLIGSLQ